MRDIWYLALMGALGAAAGFLLGTGATAEDTLVAGTFGILAGVFCFVIVGLGVVYMTASRSD